MHKVIFKTVVGSRSHGTNTATSDFDTKGVYMQSIDDLVGFGYKEQIDDSKDDVSYELRRFLQLAQTANPTIIELLFAPEDCVIHTSDEWEVIKKHRDMFVTKAALKSFGGYAVQQIRKATGLDKKMNWENKRVERLSPLDFMYIIPMATLNRNAIPIKEYIEEQELDENTLGAVPIKHFRDCFWLVSGGHGLAVEGVSNSIRTLENSKDYSMGTLFYNKDAYTIHCKEYLQYQDWLKNRNTARYVDVKGHNQKIDGKNLMHCRRLLDMAMEIAKEGVVQVRRPNADYLLQIRRGEVSLEEIIAKAEEDVKGLDALFANSSLPEECDKEAVSELLLRIRNMNGNMSKIAYL